MIKPETKARSVCWNNYCILNCVKWYTCTLQDNCETTEQMYQENLEKFKKEAEENERDL